MGLFVWLNKNLLQISITIEVNAGNGGVGIDISSSFNDIIVDIGDKDMSVLCWRWVSN